MVRPAWLHFCTIEMGLPTVLLVYPIYSTVVDVCMRDTLGSAGYGRTVFRDILNQTETTGEPPLLAAWSCVQHVASQSVRAWPGDELNLSVHGCPNRVLTTGGIVFFLPPALCFCALFVVCVLALFTSGNGCLDFADTSYLQFTTELRHSLWFRVWVGVCFCIVFLTAVVGAVEMWWVLPVLEFLGIVGVNLGLQGVGLMKLADINGPDLDSHWAFMPGPHTFERPWWNMISQTNREFAMLLDRDVVTRLLANEKGQAIFLEALEAREHSDSSDDMAELLH